MIRKFEDADKPYLYKLFQILTGTTIPEADVVNRMAYVRSSPIDSLYVYELNNAVVGSVAFTIRKNIEETVAMQRSLPLPWMRRIKNRALAKNYWNMRSNSPKRTDARALGL